LERGLGLGAANHCDIHRFAAAGCAVLALMAIARHLFKALSSPATFCVRELALALRVECGSLLSRNGLK
jgi:hypothetical protein